MTIFSDELTERDQQTVRECLLAAEQKEFFEEWEFESLFGISRAQLSSVREKWPDVAINDKNVGPAVIGAMNHLLGYPHGKDILWKKYISVDPIAIQTTLNKLLAIGL